MPFSENEQRLTAYFKCWIYHDIGNFDDIGNFFGTIIDDLTKKKNC